VNLGYPVFTEAKDDGSGGDNWSYKSCKAPVKSSPSTNQRVVFYRPDALPVAQPTMLKHWRKNITHSLDLFTSSSPGGLPTLSSTTHSLIRSNHPQHTMMRHISANKNLQLRKNDICPRENHRFTFNFCAYSVWSEICNKCSSSSYNHAGFFAFKNQRYIVAVYSLHDADLYRRDSMAIGYSSDNQTLAELKLKTLSEWVSYAKWYLAVQLNLLLSLTSMTFVHKNTINARR